MRLLKYLIYAYIATGVVIVLAIVVCIFIVPAVSPGSEVSARTLSLMEKVLLFWGLSLLPILKFGYGYVLKKKHGEKLRN